MKYLLITIFCCSALLIHAQTNDVTVTTSGNVGIGTNTPGNNKLSIKNQGDGKSLLKLETQSPWVFFQNGEGSNWNTHLGLKPEINNSFFEIVTADGQESIAGFRVKNGGTSNIILVPSGGTVFIGDPNIHTLTSDTDLSVEGTIMANKYYGAYNGNWPDFVFEHSYKLRTLEEVEWYVNKNGHLPEIPSETEVTENGINLGEMDAKLLQKIEELTLYLIEQNKKIERLEKEVSALKNE